jgi:hypothetical protein
MICDKTDFTVNVTCYAPQGSPVQPSAMGILVPPQQIKDLKAWKDVGKHIALAFYRAHSGDHRGEELVKEFEKL